jgi:hypothetical protein
MNDTYARKSLLWSALALPLTLFVGKVVEIVLKTTNPSHVNIAHPLAYLTQGILSSIFTILVCWTAALIYAFMAHKRGEDRAAVKLAATALVLVMCLTLVALIANNITTSKVEHTKLLTNIQE